MFSEYILTHIPSLFGEWQPISYLQDPLTVRRDWIYWGNCFISYLFLNILPSAMPHLWPSLLRFLWQAYQWHSLWTGKGYSSFSLFLFIDLSIHCCCKTLSAPMSLTPYHRSPLGFPAVFLASYSYHFHTSLLSAISVLCCIFFLDKLSWFHPMVFELMSSKHVLSPSIPLASNSVQIIA